MDPWTVGLVAVVVLGLAAITYGALHDRARNRRAATEMLSPPQRHIPQFRPDAPAPAYLSELQARRTPEGAVSTELSPDDRSRVAEQLRAPGTVEVRAGYASRDFVTDTRTGQAVLDGPRVLVCADRVESTRELLPTLERFLLSGTPLVVVAPGLSDEVRGTLEVNRIRQHLRLLAVVAADPADRQRLAAATGAEVRDRGDLQSGYVWEQHLGRCARWVSTAKQSYVVEPVADRGV